MHVLPSLGYTAAMIRLITIATCVALFAVVSLGDRPPAARPTTAAAAATSKPTTVPCSGGPNSIMHQEYTFNDPPVGWIAARRDDDELIQFVDEKKHAEIQITFEPKDLELAGMAPQFLKAYKDMRAKAKTVMVMQPTIEKDKRFDIKIHEKFKVENETEDELHIYKSIGPRVIEMTIATTAGDSEVIDDVFTTGQDLLTATKFDRKAFLKQKKIEDQQQHQQQH